MKKLICILSVLCMLLSLAACSEPEPAKQAVTPSTTQPTEPSEPEPGENEPGENEPMEHEHAYTTTVTEPTCTEDGFTTYLCACGDSYDADVVKTSGHKDVQGMCQTCGQQVSCYVALTEGDWTCYDLSTEQLEVLTLQFYADGTATSFCGIYYPLYQMYPDAPSIDYLGVTYFYAFSAMSVDFRYVEDGDRILLTAGSGYARDLSEGQIVLQRSGTELKVLSINGEIHANFGLGAVFTSYEGHTFSEATCTEGEICQICGIAGHGAHHDYLRGECGQSMICQSCGAESEPTQHEYDWDENDRYTCIHCGQEGQY